MIEQINKEFIYCVNNNSLLVIDTSHKGSVRFLAGQSGAVGINEGSPLPEGLDFVLEMAESVGSVITIRVVRAQNHGLVLVALVVCGSGFVGCGGGFVGSGMIGCGSGVIGCGSVRAGSRSCGYANGQKSNTSLHCW